jgi:hypothetical protein
LIRGLFVAIVPSWRRSRKLPSSSQQPCGQICKAGEASFLFYAGVFARVVGGKEGFLVCNSLHNKIVTILVCKELQTKEVMEVMNILYSW